MRFLTSGESHGKQLTAIIEGLPSNLKVSSDFINKQLALRQIGYGRGRRMQIEQDKVEIVSGVRFGKTTGAPLTLIINNRDWANWEEIMSVEDEKELELKKMTSPRPGHADLNGAIKYNLDDLRNVLERASARETAIRVAIGAVAKQLLNNFNIALLGHVINIGGVNVAKQYNSIEEIREKVINSDLRCFDDEKVFDMIKIIDNAKENGDTIGGIIEVIVEGVPIGFGSHVHWDRKLDAKIAQAIMSIQAIKGVEFGDGFKLANQLGSKSHDEIFWDKNKGFYRISNHAGGFEGGITNGSQLVIRAVMKPIPTLYKPLNSVDIKSKQPFKASIERSDTCAVPAASVVAEHIVAWEIANALLEKFGSDNLEEIKERFEDYLKYVMRF